MDSKESAAKFFFEGEKEVVGAYTELIGARA
jgi:hypothetical protein